VFVMLKILIKANIKSYKESLIGIFILILLISLSISVVISVYNASNEYINSEIQRVDFGDITVWLNNDSINLEKEILKIPQISNVKTQDIIFSDYKINEQESDSRGQLILCNSVQYKFFNEDLNGYVKEIPKIKTGEVYINASMASIFGIKIGDKIEFPIARNNNAIVLKIAGFYEDPVMGSSMIGMKGFLVNSEDFENIKNIIEKAEINALAEKGKMVHIFSSDNSPKGIAELNKSLNTNKIIAENIEFIYTKSAIFGFMLVLQNAYCGIMISFVFVLLIAVAVVLYHSVKGIAQKEYKNISILRTMGITANWIYFLWLCIYSMIIISSMLAGFILSIFAVKIINLEMVTTTGVLIPTDIPFFEIIILFAVILFILYSFIYIGFYKIKYISPIGIIRKKEQIKKFKTKIHKEGLLFSIALRQIISGKRNYLSVLIVSALLVFFIMTVGHIKLWIGNDGKGMMDAFNPAEHDLGVQLFGDSDITEAEDIILEYSDITDGYTLAMPSVAVNGISYTANVISEPNRFHIFKGKSCMNENEIVLTDFSAEALGVDIGDNVEIMGNSRTAEFTVSGIYQCADDMGQNIGMSKEGYLKIGKDDNRIWCHHYFLEDTSKKIEIKEALENKFGGDIHIHENTWTGLFGIISAMNILVNIMYFLAVIFVMTTTAMTCGKLILSEEKDLMIYKILGLSSKKLRLGFSIRFLIISFFGSVAGWIFSEIFTMPLVSVIMRFAGISSFKTTFSIVNIIIPITVITILFLLSAYLFSHRIEKFEPKMSD